MVPIMGIVMPVVLAVVIAAVPGVLIVVISLMVVTVGVDDIDLGESAVSANDATGAKGRNG